MKLMMIEVVCFETCFRSPNVDLSILAPCKDERATRSDRTVDEFTEVQDTDVFMHDGFAGRKQIFPSMTSHHISKLNILI